MGTRAERDPSADTQTKHWTKRVYPAHAGLRDSRPQRSNTRRDSVEMWSILYRLNLINGRTITRTKPRRPSQSPLHKPHFTSTSTITLCPNLKKLMHNAIG